MINLKRFGSLQWFGVLLARVLRKDLIATHLGVNLYRDTAVGWKWLRWLWPLTGWWSDYRWIARRK